MDTRPGDWVPDLKDIQVSAYRIEGHINHTPIMKSTTLDDMTGGELFFKCENLQKVGAFKFRGAANAVLSLSDDVALNGVATHSSGNHAQALALAARIRGIPAFIVMPENSPRVKVEAVKGYGGQITFCRPTLESREDTLEEVVKRTGARFVHPYNDPWIIAGQATAAMELLNEVRGLDMVMTPVGGGGLLSGTALSTKYMSSRTEVVGTEPMNADDAYRSFRTGKLLPAKDPVTIADGLRTSLGGLNFKIIMTYVDDIVTVTEEGIKNAMRTVWERMKLVIEPSAAVPLGALLERKKSVKNKRVGIILSGGNVDLNKLPWFDEPL
ncbi:MAG: pyridoxal-phosphate dependent enzyme [Thermoplasmatota archaeon]